MANICDEPGIEVNEWLSGRHRALLSDFVIGTVDQVLMAALLKKFIMLLHLGIAGKVIIIDEIHAYDAYMTAYLNAVLSWAGAYHVPVILLSATLPVQKKAELIKAYTKCDNIPEMNDYPSITWSDGKDVFVKNVSCDAKEKTVYIKYLGISDAIDNIEKQSESCVCIISNTVKHAQDLYSYLCKQLPDRNIILLHSRFLADDRARLEHRVIDAIGKNSTHEIRKGTIIIGTQVLEQSLDIDCDILYTEKCPIDLLLQRIGRQFRHNRPYRHEDKQCCYVIKDSDIEKSARRVYGDYLIEQTDKIIRNTVIEIPKDIRKLTEHVYDFDKSEDSEAKTQFLLSINEMKQAAKSYLIPDPEYAEFVGLIDHDAGNLEGVRYGNLGTEILLWKRMSDGSISTLDEKINIEGYPSNQEKDILLNQTINVRSDMVDYDELDLVKNKLPFWAKSGVFKYKSIVLVDEHNICMLKGIKYIYNNEYGFRKVPINE